MVVSVLLDINIKLRLKRLNYNIFTQLNNLKIGCILLKNKI